MHLFGREDTGLNVRGLRRFRAAREPDCSRARSACVRGGDDPLLWRTQSLEAPRLFLAIAKLCFALFENATLLPRGFGQG